MASLRVILLDRTDGGRFRYALWADVPLARQPFYANPAATSAWRGATAADLDALRAGAVVEHVDVLPRDGLTAAQVTAALEQLWQAFQARVTAYNPWVRYGSRWDGDAWTVDGVS